MNTNEAVNITFDSFPPELIKKTNQIPSYQFIQGGALIFSQSYSGDVYVFILYPVVENHPKVVTLLIYAYRCHRYLGSIFFSFMLNLFQYLIISLIDL